MADPADTDQIVIDPPADDSPEAGIEALRQQITAATEATKAAEGRAEAEKRGRDAERQAREEAERRADAASGEARATRRSAAEAQYDSVINALAAAQGDLAGAQAQLESAMAEGDFKKVAALSAEIGLAAVRVREFETGKTALEERRKQGDDTGAAPQGDPKEAFIRTKTARTAAWLRRNDNYFSDTRFQAMVTGAHQIAIGRGIEPDSDEYFQFIEEQAGLRAPASPPPPPPPPGAESGNGVVSLAAATAARSAVPAAPPGGSTQGAARAAGAGTITLSPEEREFCRREEIDEVAYAKQKKQLMDEGKYGPGSH